MANIKEYKIVINGLEESINAVDSLNKQLNALETKIKALESKTIKVNVVAPTVTSSGTSSKSSSKASMSEEEKLSKQIEQTDAKREAYSKKIYQNYLAAKDVLSETIKDQKAISAQERLQANTYTNTMAGMKQELADLKTVMNTTDLGDDTFKQMSQRARELTAKLKELEQSYGQFGRDVGNYDRIGQGLEKLVIEVGGVSREFSSTREAARILREELVNLEIQGKGNTDEAKDLRKAYNNLKSAMDDATKSSKAMDEAMDWMQSFTSMASIGNGLKAFFGFDDNEITKSIQKLVALQNVLNGIESIRKQMDTSEGIGAILSKGSEGVDKFVASITGAKLGVEGLTKGSRLATVAVRSLSIAMKSLGIGLIIAAITTLMQVVEKAGNAIQSYFKGNAELANSNNAVKSSIDAENNALQNQRKILSTNYLKGYISDTEYAKQNVMLLTQAISDNAHAIQMQAISLIDWQNKIKPFIDTMRDGFKNPIKISSEFLDMNTIIKNMEGAKKAWEDFKKAVEKGEDVVTATGARSLSEWLGSFITTADDAKDDFVQIGQTIAGAWVHAINEVDTSTEEGRATLKKLIDELNNDKVIHSVLMNLGDYFDDEKIVKKIQNVIDYANQLNDSFQFDLEASPEGYNYWEQVRIDAMNGAAKVRAQIELDKKKELEQLEKNGEISAKHRQEIEAKYNKRLVDQTKQFGQEQRDAQNDFAKTRIEAMKEGWEKEKAQLEQERKERIQKVVQSGILVSQRTEAINALYDKKILDAKKKWAADMLKVYEDLYQNIQQLNRQTFNQEADTASMNVENRASSKKQEVGYSLINEKTFDNSKVLEEYYKKVLEIEKKASEDQAKIQQERLDKELDYNKQEEELRHKRIADSETGELKQQLDAGKITLEQYNKLIEDENAAHYSRMNALDKEYKAQSTQVVQDTMEEQQRLYNEFYTSIIAEIKKNQDKISKESSNIDKRQDNAAFGLFNIKAVMKGYDELISKEKIAVEKIRAERDKLIQDKNSGKISGEDFLVKMEELDAAEEAAMTSIEDLEKKQKASLDKFIGAIMAAVQVVGQSIQQIMQAVWDAQDYQMEKEFDELDKWNEELDNKLQEQQDIVEKHKDNVDSIEDELATARGDRRQHLIDQLNAEVDAQRAAQREEQRIQKEQEKAKKREEALEKKRREQEYKRNVMQAFISWHLAIANGLATQPFLPVGIAMGALATTLGAIQYALVKSQKPYAKGGQLDGGVAQGKRHRDGGIPVLGGRASIEGGEFITNRTTTAKNIDLLEYINSKKKRVDINDLIEFYGTTPRKTIRAVRTKFEDGGYLPTLPNSLDIREQLQNIVVNQDNRPIYVSVVDINNKQEDVRRVQALAGITQ